MSKLISVHDALTNASLASRPLPGKPISFRVEDEVKAECSDICRRHGTTITEFLRQCCLGLVSDYKAPTKRG